MADAPGMEQLKQRLSKKVAALTSVIHNLHNKAGDYESDMQEEAHQYDKEIEQILSDTVAHINRFQSQLEGERDDKRKQVGR